MPSQRSSRYWWIRSVGFGDFAGGLNLRDSPLELAPNETPDALNWPLDTRGAARLRNGCLNAVALPGTSGKPAFIFFSAALNLWLCVRESATQPHLFKRPADLSGSWTDVGAIYTGGPWNPAPGGSQVASFVDFPGPTPKVVFVIPLMTDSPPLNGGINTYDGTTVSHASSFAGAAIALWEDRVWAAGSVDVLGGNPTTLIASKLGDPSVWDVPSGGLSVDLRDKDGALLTGLGIAGGALVVFKQRSAYRVNDPGTGSYSTIDASAGCQGPLAVVSLRGRLYTWGADSLYEWDGVGPGVKVGDKARPLFATDAALVGGVPGLAGGSIEDRALYAYPSVAGGDNDRLLEFDPQHGWLMKGQLAGSTKTKISSFARKGADLYAAVMNGDVMFKMMSETPGADDGVPFANNFRTAWVEPAGGMLCRVIRADIEGLLVAGGTNTLKLRVYKDGELGSYDEYDLTSDLRAPDATDQLQRAVVRSLGHARSFAFEFVANA